VRKTPITSAIIRESSLYRPASRANGRGLLAGQLPSVAGLQQSSVSRGQGEGNSSGPPDPAGRLLGRIAISGGRINLSDVSDALTAPITMSGGSLVSQALGGATNEVATYGGTLTIALSSTATIESPSPLTLTGGTAGVGDLVLQVTRPVYVQEQGFGHAGGLFMTGSGTAMFEAPGTYGGPTVSSISSVAVRHADALGDPTQGTLLQRGYLYIQSEGVREPTKVTGGTMILEADSHPGPITLAGGDSRAMRRWETTNKSCWLRWKSTSMVSREDTART
jgi:hypothetical protein